MEEIQWKAWIFSVVRGEPAVVVLGFKDECQATPEEAFRRNPRHQSEKIASSGSTNIICPNAAL